MLGVLHSEHLAHRTLTPHNILLIHGKHAVLQDVGIAAQPFIPGEGAGLYQAPEQIRMTQDKAIPGPHTDIYRLGAVLYHILTGNIASSSPIIPPSTWNNILPQELDAVLLKAIDPVVRSRWHRMYDFARAIRGILQ